MSPMPRILPDDSYWMDRRLLDVYHNQFAYKAEPPATIEEWKAKRDFTRAQVAMAAGLNPMPVKNPLEPKVWGHEKHEGTVIAKVCFESMPGLKVTGNLYFPERVKNQCPGILCPHGHWQTGRVHNDERGSVPMRCVMLARLGFIVFSYDMIGYNDNNEILHQWPEPILREAALSGAGLYGLQTWNSMRALDFLCDLPEVDERRIGCTGTSGGGSQTWTISIMDDRIKVMAPVCMLSSHFQGGCQCEEGPLLRINGVTSFDILAACAPRPLLLPAVTQDWTNLNPRYEVQALRKVYALFDADDALRNFQLDAPHNYNKDTRERMYPWFTHWLLNQSLRETIQEDDVAVPAPAQLLHSESITAPTPQTTVAHLAKIIPHLCADALPEAEKLDDARAFRAERIQLIGDIVNYEQGLKDVAVRVTCPQWELSNGKAEGCLISRRDAGDVIPAVRIKSAVFDPRQPACLLLSGNGKKDFFQGGSYATLASSLVDKGCNCLAVDLMGCGETEGLPEKAPRNEKDPSFFAFNSTLFSMRVQDILTSLTLLKEDGYGKIAIVAVAGSVKPALCAMALAAPIYAAAIDMGGQGDSPADWMSLLDFQPMILKAGGMKGLAAMANVDNLGLYRAKQDFTDYVGAFSAKLGVPRTLFSSGDSMQRLAEQVICTMK